MKSGKKFSKVEKLLEITRFHKENKIEIENEEKNSKSQPSQWTNICVTRFISFFFSQCSTILAAMIFVFFLMESFIYFVSFAYLNVDGSVTKGDRDGFHFVYTCLYDSELSIKVVRFISMPWHHCLHLCSSLHTYHTCLKSFCSNHLES